MALLALLVFVAAGAAAMTLHGALCTLICAEPVAEALLRPFDEENVIGGADVIPLRGPIFDAGAVLIGGAVMTLDCRRVGGGERERVECCFSEVPAARLVGAAASAAAAAGAASAP